VIKVGTAADKMKFGVGYPFDDFRPYRNKDVLTFGEHLVVAPDEKDDVLPGFDAGDFGARSVVVLSAEPAEMDVGETGHSEAKPVEGVLAVGEHGLRADDRAGVIGARPRRPDFETMDPKRVGFAAADDSVGPGGAGKIVEDEVGGETEGGVDGRKSHAPSMENSGVHVADGLGLIVLDGERCVDRQASLKRQQGQARTARDPAGARRKILGCELYPRRAIGQRRHGWLPRANVDPLPDAGQSCRPANSRTRLEGEVVHRIESRHANLVASVLPSLGGSRIPCGSP